MVNNNRQNRAMRCASVPTQNKKPSANGTLRRLQAIDMALTETVLYLDSYPENKAALSYYEKLVEERERLAKALSHDGRPITHHDSAHHGNWDWISSPWPWDIEANI